MRQSYALAIELKCEYQGKPCQKGFMEDMAKVCAGIKPDFVGPKAVPVPNEWNAAAANAGTLRERKTSGTTVLCMALTTVPEDLVGLEKVMEADLQQRVGNNGYQLPIYYKQLWKAMPGQQWEFDQGPVDLWMLWFESRVAQRPDGSIEQLFPGYYEDWHQERPSWASPFIFR